jgi:electron transfer flavoprotein beta subunit
MGLRIAVCVKPVPDSAFYDRITIDAVTKRVQREGIPTIINTLDKHAIEAALQLKEKHGGEVTIFTMAPDNAADQLRRVLAMGADKAYLLSDRPLGGADTLATSYTLSKAIEMVGDFDLILLGNESEDGGTAQVPSQLGEWLFMPHFSNVDALTFDGKQFEARRKTARGHITYEVMPPAVFAVRREMNTPRIPTVMGIMKSKNKPITIFRTDALALDEHLIGMAGSPTQPGDLFAPDMSRKNERIEDPPEAIAQFIIKELRKQGIVLNEGVK